MKHVLLVILLVITGPLTAGPQPFARLVNGDAGQPRALQLAIATYAPAAGTSTLQVDLISAIHIGDQAYYRDLNKRFRAYDAVLFELIIGDDTDLSRDFVSGGTLVSDTQIGLKNALALSFQLDEIDYRAPNLVHADLTTAMLREQMDARGESLYVYFWRLFFASIDEYARDPLGLNDMRLMTSLLSAQRNDALKIAIARELADSTRNPDLLGGETGSAVIAARNAHAIDVLRRELDGDAQRIGIFYGLAHMPDFDARLTGELQLERVGTAWVDAWRFGTEDGGGESAPD